MNVAKEFTAQIMGTEDNDDGSDDGAVKELRDEEEKNEDNAFF